MSASNQRSMGIRNPAKKFIKWKGARKQGFFEYYDKEEQDEKKRNKIIDLSKGFWILDKDLFSVTGFDETTKSNIISNEVRTVDDKLVVKKYTKGNKQGQVIAQGSYSEIKPNLKTLDGKYTKSVYIKLKETGEVCHIALHGASFAQWLKDVDNNSKSQNSLIIHSATEDGTKGSLEYKFPVFTVGPEASPAEWAAIVKDDSEILQPYLEAYLAKNAGGAPAPAQQQESSIDTTTWRKVKAPDGKLLGEMTYKEVMELDEMMIENGDAETDLYQFVGQAVYDYQQFAKTWDSKKDQSGKLLSAYTVDELNALLGKLPSYHKERQTIYLALDAVKATGSAEVWDDDDDGPF